MKSRTNLGKYAGLAVQGLALTIMVSSCVMFYTTSDETLRELRTQVKWPLVPLLAIPVLLSWICNGTRFYLMTRCIGHSLPWFRAVAIAISSEFGIAASPGGLGGAAIRLGFLKKSGISIVHGGALMTADLFIDKLLFIIATPFALSILVHRFDGASMAVNWKPLLALLIPPLVVAVLFGIRRHGFRMLRQHGLLQSLRLEGRVRLARRNLLHGFRQGRSAIGLIFRNHRKSVLINTLLSGTQIACRYSVLPLAIGLLGISVNPVPLILIQGILFFISILAVAPGGGGSVELLAALALSKLMPLHLVGVAVLLWRLFTYHFYLVFGGMVFAATFRRLKTQKAYS
ncbi:MAG: flippase-like domain-containing protein [Pontiellaceae bacterium]|nr:flippase-like domain-containing protein [Pontiellaceae bacterium]